MKVYLRSVDDVRSVVDEATQMQINAYVGHQNGFVDIKSIMGIFSLNLLEYLQLRFENESSHRITTFINHLRLKGIKVEEE